MAAFVSAGSGGVQADEPPGLGPGCDPERAVIAHYAGGVLAEQTGEGPMLCTMYTGFPGGEARINVTNSGAVIFSPAPYLRGIASLGYGPDREPTARQWMFQNGGVAVTHDNGATWRLVKPHNMTWTMDDIEAHVDRDTGRFYWSNLTPNPYPQLQPGAIPIYEHTILTDSHILTTPDDGLTWSHARTCCPIADRVWFLTAKSPPGQPEPVPGYPNVAYYVHPQDGGTVSRSLDAGNSWTVVGNLTSGETAGCAPESSRMGTHIAADQQGFLYVPLRCDGGAYLARSTDAAATWHLRHEMDHAGPVRIDNEDNMYRVRLVDNERLLLAVSGDLGATWSPEHDLTAPGLAQVHDPGSQGRGWFFQVRDPGHLVVSYHGWRDGQQTRDGFMTVTRTALDSEPLFWSAQVNDPEIPMLYGNTLMGVSGGFPPLPPPQIDHIGADIGPDGSAWAAFTEDCGPSPDAPRCQEQNIQTRGLAGRLVWPEST